MSWLARSIVNTLRGQEDEDDDDHNPQPQSQSPSTDQNPNISPPNREDDRRQDGPDDDDEDEDPTRGVKEDLSELTKTLTRQFWGVASFLAPPPASGDGPSPDPGQRADPAGSDEAEGVNSPRLAGIRSDFAEIGGRFKSGISMLSNAKAVSEISKIASTFLEFGLKVDEEGESEERYEGGAVGVTEEVLLFATNISMHPETWLDFPLIPDEDDSDEFDMSDAQQEHAMAVERLAPRLAALRIELCPSHMSEGRFWKIYFVLLHSRLNRPDAELLTTPQIVQARALLLQDLQSRTKPKSEESARSASSLPKEEDTSVPLEHNVIPPSDASAETSSTKTLTVEEPSISVPITVFETEKHTVTTEVKIIDKSVIEEDPPVQTKTANFSSDTSSPISIQKYEEEGDDWLEGEEIGEAGGSRAAVSLGDDEDVSFSDLEVDDDDEGPSKNSKTINNSGDSQQKDSKGGQKNSGAAKSGHSISPQNEESSYWLNIDDIDIV